MRPDLIPKKMPLKAERTRIHDDREFPATATVTASSAMRRENLDACVTASRASAPKPSVDL
jgi:hypothetical protein